MKEELKELYRYIDEWLRLKKVGSLTINFFKGGISSIGIKETKKLGEDKQ